MCEIFPEVSYCCYFCPLRVGMLFIAVLAVITGSLTLSIIEQTSGADYESLRNVSGIRKGNQVMSQIGPLIKTGISGISVLFMATGFVLLFAALMDQDGFMQVFVWVTFANIIIGFLMIIAISFECLMLDECLFVNMDWLTSSSLLVMLIAYLHMWIYFVIVTNSYVIQVGG